MSSYLLLCLAFLGLSSFGGGGGKEQEVPEYHLKAAFLYNFAVFTDWPKDAFKDRRSPLIVAVVGKDPFGKHLENTFAKKQAKGRSIKIVRFKKVEDIDTCHILFVPAGEVSKIKEIRKKLGDKPVLIIGESKDFALKGGCANFYPKDKGIAFEVNPKAAERAKLTISSRLLKLARIVEEKDEGKQEEPKSRAKRIPVRRSEEGKR